MTRRKKVLLSLLAPVLFLGACSKPGDGNASMAGNEVAIENVMPGEGNAAGAGLAANTADNATTEQAAPYWQWKSRLNGKIVCAQTMQGEWDRVGGPFKSDCRTPY